MRKARILLIGCVALHGVAQAERDPESGAPLPPGKGSEAASPITDHFYAQGAYFMPQLTSRLRVDPSRATPGAVGTLLNVEQDLGLNGHPYQGRMELMFRLRERHRLRVDYEEIDRTGSQLLARDIVFGNETFLANTRANSELDWRIFGLTYTYSLLRNDRVEAAAGVAVHFVEAQARGEVPALGERQNVSGAGAFPTIPVDVTLRISRRFAFSARGQYFSASVGRFQGSLGQYHGDVQYRFRRNFAIGAGYSTTRLFLNLSKGSFPGRFSFHESGPEAFFRVSF